MPRFAPLRGGGATIVELHSNARRVDARRFYERLGFKAVGHHFRIDLAET